ncbi:MAG: glycosyltransferase family 39 protein [Candidatus Sungbacteria bacterium]|uniref:Glycosyltransferase family 39 protein n=2 Tax=Candidatus Sungiibacteriota bacterium TaxID=2750080 RepID=A0A931YDB5_9BACT|nr:glycosyltransferase family 39 protein [Candidatus Sungbacteria bacterium]
MIKFTHPNIGAAVIVISALALAVFSVRDDAVTTDESPHITAGYSYLTQKDMRLNPEHPPLIKDLAALPLLFQKINLDTGHYSWKNDVNGQWAAGSHFLYESGNNPDQIAFAARLAVMALFVLLCWLVYRWGREKYGAGAGLLALTLTAFSPNIIAHGRYVTTDVGAALAFVLALYFFVKFINQPSKKNLVYAGLAFGLAQLMKFSLILLVPLFIFTGLVYWLVSRKISFSRTILSLAVIFAIGYLLVWPVYQFHVWNYPMERQKQDTEFTLRSYPFRPAAKAVLWMVDKPLLGPYAQYSLGLLMVSQRAGGGNTTYFMGEVSSTSWKSYFPAVYVLKEPIPVLILVFWITLLAMQKTILGIIRKRNLGEWIKNNFTEFVWLVFIIFYWVASINGNLNIGLRHVLPTFPFIYLLTAGQIKKQFGSKSLLTIALIFWLVIETVATYPYYLAYFNELAGGPANGYKYVADSNLDWGQDLKRLTQYVDKNGIDKIKLDYFGGGNPQYYLGGKYEKLEANNISQRHGWLAVSATLLQGGRAIATKGFDQNTTYYRWLDKYEPIAKIGYSIFVYRLD